MEREEITVYNVIDIVLNYYNVKYDDLFTKSRNFDILDARRSICWILNRDGFSLPSIALIFNNNHTTIMHNIKAINDLLSVDKSFKAKFLPLIEKFGINI